MALLYTKLWTFVHYTGSQRPRGQHGHLPRGQGRDGEEIGIPPPPANLIGPPTYQQCTAHQRVDEVRVRRAQFDHWQKRLPGLNRLKFSMLQLLGVLRFINGDSFGGRTGVLGRRSPSALAAHPGNISGLTDRGIRQRVIHLSIRGSEPVW